MHEDSSYKGYAIAAVLGAIGGGLAVVLVTKAIPKMMTPVMQRMMAGVGEGRFTPSGI